MSDDLREVEPEETGLAVVGVETVEATGETRVDILPPGSPLSRLARFVPNMELRKVADEAATYALTVSEKLVEPGGLKRLDAALGGLRLAIKTIEAHFEEPCDLANGEHKRLTGQRSEWIDRPKMTLDACVKRQVLEMRRLEELAAEEQRKQQEEADREARKTAQRAAEDAAKNGAPQIVVAALQQEAQTATAPPVSVLSASETTHSTLTKIWRTRLKGTSGSPNPQPSTKDLTPLQRDQVLRILKAVLEGRAALTTIEIAWSTLDARAKSEHGTLDIPEIEPYEDPGLRAKPARRIR